MTAETNGRIDPRRMRRVAFADGTWGLGAPGAVAAWLAFAFAAQLRFGIRPTITPPDGAYRSYARQVWWWVRRFIKRVAVARPGTSKHGLGMAFDIANYLKFNHVALVKLAREFGFEFDTSSENWHIRFLGAPLYYPLTASTSGTVTAITEALLMNDYLYLYVRKTSSAAARYILLSVTQLAAPIDTTSVGTAEGWTLAIPGLNKARVMSAADANEAIVMSKALRAAYLTAKAQERAAVVA